MAPVIDQPVANVVWVQHEELKANVYNPNHVAKHELALLKLSILRDGWTQPIVARRDGEIVDGFHRWLVSADPKIAEMTKGLIPVCYLREGLSLVDQMAATVRHNRARGVHGIKPMAELTKALLDEGVNPQVELGMEKEEVERLRDVRGMPSKAGPGGFGNGWKPG